ncbi:MAG: L-lactate dehydrogenase [Clostridiaceae bacterium]|nr:L-lactate dehydrogenase [Clostridiaceae bacterium]
MKPIKNKVVLVGAGMVGSAILNTLLGLNLVGEIVIIDNNIDKARGEALDASHTTSFAYSPNVHVRVGDYEDCVDAQTIVISAGPSMKPGEKMSRLVLAERNVKVMDSVMTSICKYTKDAVIIVVTNPVDIITYHLQNNFGYPKNKIIGTGTLLDTARFRRILALKYLVDTKNVHGYILGEHGESAFATWSLVDIAGIPAQSLDDIIGSTSPLNCDEVVAEVKTVGTEILQLKGYTSSGIAMSVSRLVKAVLLNELSILPVSTTLEGEYGISNVALSIPCVISSEGISKRLVVPLSETEAELLKKSAEILSSYLSNLQLL